jgi:hypothetical protein
MYFIEIFDMLDLRRELFYLKGVFIHFIGSLTAYGDRASSHHRITVHGEKIKCFKSANK